MTELKGRFTRIAPLALLCVFGLVPLHWFKADFINGGDFGFPMAPASTVLKSYVSVWTDKWGLGLFNSRQLPQAPFMGLLSVLNAMQISPQASERILFVLLFGISGIGLYSICLSLPLGPKKNVIAFLAALFYMFNSFNVIFYWHILDGMVFFYAFASIAIALYLRWFFTGRLYFGVLFFVANFLSGYTWSNPILIPVFWFTVLIFHVCALPNWDSLSLRKGLRFYLGTLGLWALLSAWWLIPLMAGIRDEYAGLAASRGTPWDTLTAFSRTASFLNLFRLNDLYWAFSESIFGVPYYSYSAIYHSLPFLLIGITVPLVAFFPLARENTRTRVIAALSFCMLTVMFLMKGTHSPGGTVLYRLFFEVPLLSAFRSPIHKLGATFMMLYAVLWAAGICAIHFDVGQRSRRGVAVASGILLFCTLGVYAFPLWTGEVVNEKGREYPSFHVNVPEYFRQTGEFLAAENKQERFYVVPQSPTFNVAYKWENGYLGADPSFNFFPLLGVYSTVEELAQLPYVMLRDSGRRDTFKVLRLMGVRYIVLHNDINEHFWDVFSDKLGGSSFLKTRLDQQEFIQKVRTFGKIDLYEIDDDQVLPVVYSSVQPYFIVDIIRAASSKTLPAGAPVIFSDPAADAFAEKTVGERPGIAFRKTDPSTYVITLTGAAKPFWLVCGENFQPSWGVFLDRKQLQVPHFRVNGFANGWFIDPAALGLKKDCTIIVYFKKQSLFYAGILVSLATALASCALAAARRLRVRRQ